jgi:hypothetical protein
MTKAPETRETAELRFRAYGEDGTLPQEFGVQLWVQPQEKDGRRTGGWVNSAPPAVTEIPVRLTRRQLEVLIADGVSWLAYDGKD